MADETTQPTKQELSGKERFENRQAGKKRALENNPEAMVFVPESPIARILMNSIMTFDSVDAFMRANAGLNIEFKEFEEHIKVFQELSQTFEKSNNAILNLLAKNTKVETRFIRNRFTRKAVENLRKEAKKLAVTEVVAVETKKVEVEAPKK
jgi:hypothetical protein